MSRRLFSPARPPDSTEETVWISFSDLMTALLAVFMLAAVALVYSLAQEQEALAEVRADADRARAEAQEATARSARFDDMLDRLGTGEQVRVEMVTAVRDRLAERGIRVEVDRASSVVHVPVDLLGFDSGSSEIQPQHQASATVIGEVVADVLLEDERYQLLDTVFIEGHTDDVPMDRLFGGNWGLSSNRAISLWRLWRDEVPRDLAGLVGHSGERLVSVSGYADTRPVNRAQRTEGERAANRRIDLRFTEHKLSEDEISAVRDATAGSP